MSIVNRDVICSMCCLQVGKMGTGAIAISLPFSCVLGLLSSMTASTMGMWTTFKNFKIGESLVIVKKTKLKYGMIVAFLVKYHGLLS